MKKFLRPLYLLLFYALLPAVSPAQVPGWTSKANFGGDARHRAVGICIGTRGYMGLGHINAVTDILYDDWWEYDPGSNSWTQKATFPGGQRMHSSAFSVNGKAEE